MDERHEEMSRGSAALDVLEHDRRRPESLEHRLREHIVVAQNSSTGEQTIAAGLSKRVGGVLASRFGVGE